MATKAGKGKGPKAKPTTPSPPLVFQRARSWIAAAIFQGDRMMALIKLQTDNGPEISKWTAEQRRAVDAACMLSDGSLVEVYEGFCFLVTLRMVRCWLDMAKQVEPSVKGAVEEFEDHTRHAIDVRDMQVHEDAYLVGAGRKQPQYMYDFESLFETSAHSVVARGDDYLIAGRVSVPGTLIALRKVQRVVDAVQV